MKTPFRAKTRILTTAETYPLRLEVLRPGKPPESAIFAGDELPGTSHWGAYRDDNSPEILAIATLMRSAAPPALARSAQTGVGSNAALAWQIRGMASSPRARGQGYGSAVLRAVIDHVTDQDPGALIWCNARVVALDFYRAHGFETQGPEFEIAGVGPHYVMWRRA